MVDDKYIGLMLALSSSLAIGTSAIITKKGLNAAADANFGGSAGGAASDNMNYLKNPVWWVGMSTLILGELANFAAYTFAPPILVTPLGAGSVLVSAVLASFLLNEHLGHLGRMGCALSMLGSLIIVLHAPEDKDVSSVDEILEYAMHPGFLLYVLTITSYTIFAVTFLVPRWGRTNPLVYVSISSLVGSVSVMAIKGFGVAVKLTMGGKNQFTRPSAWFFGLVTGGCILVQLNYFNKALDTFSVNIVNPMYYVGFSSATIVSSLILFQGFDTTDATNTVSLLAGFITTFLGVHLLNISRKEREESMNADHFLPDIEAHSSNRRRLQGRLSIDGWHGIVEGGPPGSAHRTSASREFANGGSALFDSREGRPRHNVSDSVGLERLNEESESESEMSDDDELGDERTRLTTPTTIQHGQHRGHGSRGNSVSRSPVQLA